MFFQRVGSVIGVAFVVVGGANPIQPSTLDEQVASPASDFALSRIHSPEDPVVPSANFGYRRRPSTNVVARTSPLEAVNTIAPGWNELMVNFENIGNRWMLKEGDIILSNPEKRRKQERTKTMRCVSLEEVKIRYSSVSDEGFHTPDDQNDQHDVRERFAKYVFWLGFADSVQVMETKDFTSHSGIPTGVLKAMFDLLEGTVGRNGEQTKWNLAKLTLVTSYELEEEEAEGFAEGMKAAAEKQGYRGRILPDTGWEEEWGKFKKDFPSDKQSEAAFQVVDAVLETKTKRIWTIEAFKAREPDRWALKFHLADRRSVRS